MSEGARREALFEEFMASVDVFLLEASGDWLVEVPGYRDVLWAVGRDEGAAQTELGIIVRRWLERRVR